MLQKSVNSYNKLTTALRHRLFHNRQSMKEKIIEGFIWFIIIIAILGYWVHNNNYTANPEATFIYLKKTKDNPDSCNSFYAEMFTRSNAVTNLLLSSDKNVDRMAWKCVNDIIKNTKIEQFPTGSPQIINVIFFWIITNSFADKETITYFWTWFIKDDFINAWKIWSINNPSTYNKCYELTMSLAKKLPVPDSDINLCWNKVMEFILTQKFDFKRRFY